MEEKVSLEEQKADDSLEESDEMPLSSGEEPETKDALSTQQTKPFVLWGSVIGITALVSGIGYWLFKKRRG